MRLLKFFIVCFPILVCGTQEKIIAMDINCDSPVWRNNELCKEESNQKKYIGYGNWFPFGFSENGNAVNWAQLLSYKKLNANSFRLKSKFLYTNNEIIEGKLDVNCKNKDYYLRPNGVMSQRSTWAGIPRRSGIEILSKYLCKRTSAKKNWGYTQDTSYLWDQPSPQVNPSNASGEWLQHSNGLGWYNTEIYKTKNSVIYAYYTKSKVERPYLWVNNSCNENLASIFFQPNESVKGEWLTPTPGRPGGANETVRKIYCK
tara:strand:+ start:612 stop:1388 length:777 start_codon:yes stop_codon:yes gene_type:complete